MTPGAGSHVPGRSRQADNHTTVSDGDSMSKDRHSTRTETVRGDAAEREGEQSRVTRRYDRMAWLYDIYDAPMEWMGTKSRRRRLLARASGRVLEVGVGTGKNLEHHPKTVSLSAIDVSPSMLSRARRRAEGLDRAVHFGVADVAALPFQDDTFDTAVATCVFCSVADPVEGLRELGRVTKPEGRILMLEHVRPRRRLLGWLADLATSITRRLFGFRANRRTEENVTTAGLDIVEVRREGVWREIVAQPARPASDASRPSWGEAVGGEH